MENNLKFIKYMLEDASDINEYEEEVLNNVMSTIEDYFLAIIFKKVIFEDVNKTMILNIINSRIKKINEEILLKEKELSEFPINRGSRYTETRKRVLDFLMNNKNIISNIDSWNLIENLFDVSKNIGSEVEENVYEFINSSICRNDVFGEEIYEDNKSFLLHGCNRKEGRVLSINFIDNVFKFISNNEVYNIINECELSASGFLSDACKEEVEELKRKISEIDPTLEFKSKSDYPLLNNIIINIETCKYSGCKSIVILLYIYKVLRQLEYVNQKNVEEMLSEELRLEWEYMINSKLHSEYVEYICGKKAFIYTDIKEYYKNLYFELLSSLRKNKKDKKVRVLK